MCSDGTLCPKTFPSTAENTTCCAAHQGKEEINYHNNANIPEEFNDLPVYYANGGYTIPGYASTTSTSATPHPTAAGQSFSTPSSSPPSALTPTPQPAPAASLSTGAKAGIGVGTALGGAILAALLAVLILLRRRSRDRKSGPVPESDHQPPSYPVGLIPGVYPPKRGLSEIESMTPEMATQDPSYHRGELPSTITRVEMDGSRDT
ncbi:MAG: hypothetical protein Q9209_001455 [Squamulea sp. 1 TL-2023]